MSRNFEMIKETWSFWVKLNWDPTKWRRFHSLEWKIGARMKHKFKQHGLSLESTLTSCIPHQNSTAPQQLVLCNLRELWPFWSSYLQNQKWHTEVHRLKAQSQPQTVSVLSKVPAEKTVTGIFYRHQTYHFCFSWKNLFKLLGMDQKGISLWKLNLKVQAWHTQNVLHFWCPDKSPNCSESLNHSTSDLLCTGKNPGWDTDQDFLQQYTYANATCEAFLTTLH